MLCMLMSGWLEVFPSSQPTKTKRWWRLRGRRIIKKNNTLCKNSLSALRHTSGCTVWKKIQCKHLCGDNKAVVADTQTGPSVSINEESSFHAWHADSHFLPHEHTLSLTHLICMRAPVCSTPPHHHHYNSAMSWWTDNFFLLLLINQWYAREGELISRRWGVSLHKRCWWWSGCCIIRASEHRSSPRRAYVINCAKLENDIGAE